MPSEKSKREKFIPAPKDHSLFRHTHTERFQENVLYDFDQGHIEVSVVGLLNAPKQAKGGPVRQFTFCIPVSLQLKRSNLTDFGETHKKPYKLSTMLQSFQALTQLNRNMTSDSLIPHTPTPNISS